MLGFNLVVGDSEASLLETAIVISNLTNLRRCVFGMIIFLKLHNKKENALTRKKMHSQTHNWKGR